MPRTPIAYDRYRTYAEMMELLQYWADQYPHLLTLSSLGKSYEGRDIPLVEVTEKSSGPARGKPAAYFDGNIHAGEVTGSAVLLYLIGYLLENHGRDEFITDLLATRAFYIVPRISVDGAEIFMTTPQTLRSSTRLRPRFEQEGGIWPEDIDGNGHILTMRVPSPAGEWKISARDERLMIPRAISDLKGQFYHLLTEGKAVNHRAGPINLSSSRWALDLNRNFPAQWDAKEASGGTHPLSEPETRAMADFFAAHPHISVAVAYHTAAGLIMRSPCMGFDRDMNSRDLASIDGLTRRGSQLTGYPAINAYLGWSEDFPMPARGNFTHWAYDQQGMIGYTIELWDMAAEAGITIQRNYGSWWSNISEEDLLTFLAWNDRELGGSGFWPWQPFDHPQLGPVEIGGWINKWTRQNPPLCYLPDTMHKNALFAVELAAATPRVIISRVEVEELGDCVRRVYLEVANEGFLPTSGTEQAKSVGVAPTVTVTLQGDALSFKAGDQRQVLGHLDGYGPGRQGWGYLFGDRANHSRAGAEWVVIKPHAEAVSVAIEVDGGRAGRARREITL